MHVAKDQRSKLDSKSKPCIFMGYSEDEFGYRLWDLVDKKVVRSRDVVFLEDKTIEDWKQQKSESTNQSTSTTIDLRPSEPTQSVVRRQPIGTAESESVDSERPTDYESESAELLRSIEEYELESSNLEKSIDIYEPKQRGESGETPEREPTTSGRRYPLRERRAPTTYASQYILLTDEGEPECYDEAIADEHREKWLSAMQDEMDSLHENYT